LGDGVHVRLAIPQPAYEHKDYERLCATSEAVIYVAFGEAIGPYLGPFGQSL